MNIAECRSALDSGQPDREKQVYFHRLVAEACYKAMIASTTNATVIISRDITKKLEMPAEEIEFDLTVNERVFNGIKNRDADPVYLQLQFKIFKGISHTGVDVPECCI